MIGTAVAKDRARVFLAVTHFHSSPVNDPIPINEPGSPDLTRLGHATRFAIACMALGVSWLAINSCLNIPKFARIFTDMLGENERLSLLTTFVLRAHTALLALSFCIPAAVIAQLFTRDVVRSLYRLGILVFLSIVEYIVVTHAVYAPLITIIEKMQGGNP